MSFHLFKEMLSFPSAYEFMIHSAQTGHVSNSLGLNIAFNINQALHILKNNYVILRVVGILKNKTSRSKINIEEKNKSLVFECHIMFK